MKNAIYMAVASLALIIFVYAGVPRADEKSNESTSIPITSIQARDFSNLIGMSGFSDTLLRNHFKLYQGYVKNTGAVIEKLNAMLVDKKCNTPEYAELKRRLGWEFNGILLHEYYFENLGSKKQFDTNGAFHKKAIDDFGCFENWKQDFISTGLIRGIGWVVVYWDPRTNRLINVWVNEHDVGHITAAQPILVMDVFEHAYITDYNLDRTKYIEAFFENINWEVVEKRFNKCIEEKPGRKN